MEMTPRLKGLLSILALVILGAIVMSMYLGVHQVQAPTMETSAATATSTPQAWDEAKKSSGSER